MIAVPVTVTVLNSTTTDRAGIASGVNNAVARAAGALAVAAFPLLVGLKGDGYADPAKLEPAFSKAMVLAALLFAVSGAIAWFGIRDEATRTTPEHAVAGAAVHDVPADRESPAGAGAGSGRLKRSARLQGRSAADDLARVGPLDAAAGGGARVGPLGRVGLCDGAAGHLRVRLLHGAAAPLGIRLLHGAAGPIRVALVPDRCGLPGLPGVAALAGRLRLPCLRSRRGLAAGRGRVECAGCQVRTSTTAGPIFDRTRTPLTVWFTACSVANAVGRSIGFTHGRYEDISSMASWGTSRTRASRAAGLPSRRT